ncbi:Uncharacterised protein [Campylobacter geochelonis]|uniref:Uncharacterized protein n=1 Tax=Campylobacter geochelonis TaxID=1780362 RepID=A0A128EIF4_9BACT|nr:Uncharacterised protein [Campylobacter geochelonis]CZE49100.1 Uncharacterised protein [Campylobacter geochelonis]CZE51346.1 Uncharacterised protein [Campylobacter geochelonis]
MTRKNVCLRKALFSNRIVNPTFKELITSKNSKKSCKKCSKKRAVFKVPNRILRTSWIVAAGFWKGGRYINLINFYKFKREFFHFKISIFLNDHLKFFSIAPNFISFIPAFVMITKLPDFSSFLMFKKAALISLLARFLMTAFPIFLLATTANFFCSEAKK